MTAPSPVRFPLVAEVLIGFLNSDAPQADLNCAVASEVPNPRPARFVALFSAPAAGPQRLTLSTRRVIAQVYEQSEYATGQLAETVRAWIVESQYRSIGIKDVKVIGEPARFPAPGTPYRWQFTADVVVRAIPGTMS